MPHITTQEETDRLYQTLSMTAECVTHLIEIIDLSVGFSEPIQERLDLVQTKINRATDILKQKP